MKPTDSDFDALVRRYHPQVFRTALGFVHQLEDAEDITQEVFIQAFRAWAQFRGDSSPSTWLYRITIRTAYSFLEQKKRRSLFVRLHEKLKNGFDLSDNHPSPLEQIEAQESDDLLRRSLDSLPDRQRTVVVLTYYEQLTQSEIARILDLTEGAVEQLKQRAKQNLQKKTRRT